MEANPEGENTTTTPERRPQRLRAAAASALATERRALRRGAFTMGAAVRSSATLSGIERDSAELARRTNEAVHNLAHGRIAQVMDKASNDLSAWMRNASTRIREWVSGSRTVKGLGIDAQRIRKRLEQRRENRGHRTH